MTSGIGTIHVRRQRGKLILQGDGVTPRGQRYIKATQELEVESESDPRFEQRLTTAVTEMLAQPAINL